MKSSSKGLMPGPIRILVLGANGMLGSAVFRVLSNSAGFSVYGTVRSPQAERALAKYAGGTIINGIDVEQTESLFAAIDATRPDVIINCVGLVSQLSASNEPLKALPINSLLPHQLAGFAAQANARLVHISSDCVFSGRTGGYVETDEPDTQELYGRSKLLGEVDYPHAITIRTSLIGSELDSAKGLVGWFLAQQGPVKGYTRAIFSGLPAVELAMLIRDHVIPRAAMRGVWHVSAEPIAKYELLCLVAKAYGCNTVIHPDDALVIDRSLNSERFRSATGWQPKTWPQLVKAMHAFG